MFPARSACTVSSVVRCCASTGATEANSLRSCGLLTCPTFFVYVWAATSSSEMASFTTSAAVLMPGTAFLTMSAYFGSGPFCALPPACVAAALNALACAACWAAVLVTNVATALLPFLTNGRPAAVR
jgi:hypothetical protein